MHGSTYVSVQCIEGTMLGNVVQLAKNTMDEHAQVRVLRSGTVALLGISVSGAQNVVRLGSGRKILVIVMYWDCDIL